MNGLGGALYVRLEDHVWLVNWPIQVQQEDGQVGVSRRVDHKIQAGFAELAV